MLRRTKKIAEGAEIPIIGLGTWTFGGNKERNTSNDTQEIEIIKKAIELGYTHIDTAEVYGAGHAEELVGEAIKKFARESLFITTKVSPENLSYDDLINSCNESLKRLQTDYIDLYLIHSPNKNISLKETMAAMDFLMENKKIRFIGVSNFSVGEFQEAQKCTKHKIITNQIHYSILTRNNSKFLENVESKVIPFCNQNNVLVTAFRPLDKGKINGVESSLLDELTKKYNKTRAQIALNWLISKENIIAIVKSIDIEHLRENIESLNFEMEREDLFALDNLRVN